MIDEQERIRGFINRQYVKLKRVASVGSLLLLAVNLSFTIYPYVSHRWVFHNVYFGLMFLNIIILLTLWIIAHVYVNIMEMYRTESKADLLYNPYSIYALTPKEEMLYNYFHLTVLQGLYETVSGEKDTSKLKDSIEKITFWINNGYIPIEHLPEELKKWYITKKRGRL